MAAASSCRGGAPRLCRGGAARSGRRGGSRAAAACPSLCAVDVEGTADVEGAAADVEGAADVDGGGGVRRTSWAWSSAGVGQPDGAILAPARFCDLAKFGDLGEEEGRGSYSRGH